MTINSLHVFNAIKIFCVKLKIKPKNKSLPVFILSTHLILIALLLLQIKHFHSILITNFSKFLLRNSLQFSHNLQNLDYHTRFISILTH
jgi:hypothetical protein